MSDHTTEVEVRSYELDGFRHLNHAVYLNYFEFARFQYFESRGLPPARLLADGTGIHVVRIEVDYTREAVLGQRIELRTSLDRIRGSSMIIEQIAADPSRPEIEFARARVVIVWVGASGRPQRIPDDVREAFGAGSVRADADGS